MDVLRRPVNPLTVAGIGAVAIAALIGMALHPPAGFAGDGSSARGGTGEGTVLCPGGVDQWEVVTGTCPPTATGSGTPTSTQPPGTVPPGDGQVSRSKPVIVIVTTAPGSAAPGGGSAGDGRVDPGAGQDPDDDQAGDEQAGDGGTGDGDDGGAGGVSTVACPAVEDQLPQIPAGAAAEVAQNLTELRQQISEADDRLAQLAADPVDDPNFVANTVLGPLRNQRIATLDRIAIAIGRFTTRPTGLEQLAACSLDNG